MFGIYRPNGTGNNGACSISSSFNFNSNSNSNAEVRMPRFTNGPIITTKESTLGQVDFDNVTEELSKDETDKRGKYKQYTERDSVAIARYAEQNGPRRTALKFDKQYPNLNESTLSSFLKKYTAMKNRGKKNSTSRIKGIPAKRRGRPLMLGIVDEKYEIS